MLENLEALKENEIQNVNGGAYEGPCFVYVIKQGDCLSVLAQRYHTTVKTLCELNNIAQFISTKTAVSSSSAELTSV